MRLITFMFVLLLSGAAFASPGITSWYNNKTANGSLDLSITAEDTVHFNVSANETVNWTWTLDGAVEDTDQDANMGAWNYTFPSYGTYNVGVSGTNENGSTQAVNWTITAALEFTDAMGNNISIKSTPQRIVSLAPSNTEILFALGIGDSVIGVTSYCDYPPEATSKTKVGGFYNPNVEEVEILEPDLILAFSGNDITVINKLIEDCENLNCTVVGLEADTIDEIVGNIELVGKIANVNSESITGDITSRINAVESNTSSLPEEQKPGVFYVIWENPLYTGGNGTFADDLIQKAGGKNIASNLTGWQIMNAEVVLSKNPDVVICSGMGGSGTGICNNIKNDAAIKYVDAVVNNSLYVVGDPNIIERPGPRIASGLETIYAFLNFSTAEANATSVQITSPQSTSYAYGSTITLSYTAGASTPISFYRLDSGFITSFDSEAATISPGSGSHTITVWVRDASGEWGSDTLAFTVNSPPQPPTGDGGGPPPTKKPTVTTSSGEAAVSIPYIGAGSTVSVQILGTQDVDVTEISIKLKSSVSSAKITIKSITSNPGEAPSPSGNTYGYMDISHQNIKDENIDDLVIKFKVERTWIEENGLEAEDIRLKRYHDGRWDELPTAKSREDPTYIYFTSNSPGLSYFVITGVIPAPLPTTSAPVETSPPVTTPAPPPSPTSAPAEIPTTPPIQTEISKKKGICGPTIMALIGTLPMILIRTLKRKKL